eukprot:5915034-Pyramimonas_sp.AAC.2
MPRHTMKGPLPCWYPDSSGKTRSDVNMPGISLGRIPTSLQHDTDSQPGLATGTELNAGTRLGRAHFQDRALGLML